MTLKSPISLPLTTFNGKKHTYDSTLSFSSPNLTLSWSARGEDDREDDDEDAEAWCGDKENVVFQFLNLLGKNKS